MDNKVKLSPGSRWKSAVCDTEIVVVRPASAPADLRCGGAAMLPAAAERPAGLSIAPGSAAGSAAGSATGKRYGDDTLGVEVLCTKGGAGSLEIDDRTLVLREPKRLPSSD